jgi:M6 family metalloprotease-like protein
MCLRMSCYRLFAFAALLAIVPQVGAQPDGNLREFKTVEQAITAKIVKGKKEPPQPAYLGIQVASVDNDHLVITDVAADSPAARGGLKKGDELVKLNGMVMAKPESLRELLQTLHPGDSASFRVKREQGEEDVKVVLGATSRPLSLSVQRAVLGVKVETSTTTEGVKITDITPDSPADKAVLKVGDVLLKLDGAALTSPSRLTDFLAERKPGDKISVTYQRDKDEPAQKQIALVSEKGFGKGGKGGPLAGGWDTRNLNIWKKDVYQLAVIIIEYPDVKHSETIATKDWHESLFSKGTYKDKASVTGQPVHGSVNDYYQEISYGRFHLEGKVFDPVQVGKKRPEYAQTATKTALLSEAIDKLLERDGADALKSFDGIFFMYAGTRFQTQRGGLYWPHRANFSHKGQRWSYFICPEGGNKMESISVTAHEFGHMLGLPDLYAPPESPATEGLGVWCAMANQIGNGKPQHFCAWSKEQLGWLEPTVIDPSIKQKLMLRPVQHSPKECFKVLVRPDASEYFLLENRTQKGFDRDLPAEGLLVWRVANGKPVLEESHGIAGPPGPRVFLGSVPFPSTSNNAFTPYTTPSSRSPQGGGLPVHISNIRRLPDGAITFFIGYEYY